MSGRRQESLISINERTEVVLAISLQRENRRSAIKPQTARLRETSKTVAFSSAASTAGPPVPMRSSETAEWSQQRE